MSWKIPLFRIYWDQDDITYVKKALTQGENWAVGPYVTEFETLIAEYTKMKHCIVFNSGTSALHALLLAHKIAEGDEVIVPSFTFIATANAPLFVGATPVFADIEEETFGLDCEDVKEKITKKTKAILAVHYGGCPCHIQELKEVAEDYHVLLIEDAAEAFGAHLNGKKVGTFGESAMFSFCQNKIITTGDGGAAVTDSKKVCERLKLIRSHGRAAADYFTSSERVDYVRLGYNFRMSNIVAALGVSQIKKVDTIIEMRRNKARYLTQELDPLREVVLPHPPKDYYHVYQMYTIMCNRRDELMKYLGDGGIMSKVYFYPVHLTHFYQNQLKYECSLPVTEAVSSQVVTLPLYPSMTPEEMDFVGERIKMFYRVIP